MLNNRFVKFTIAVITIVIAIPLFIAAQVYAIETEDSIVTDKLTEITYSDVDTTHWAYETISDLTNCDIIHGYNDGTFKPDDKVTRAELAKILVNIAGIPISDSNTSSFTDVDNSSVMSPYIEAISPYLSRWKNTETSEILFMPDNNVRREDIIVSILKMRGTDVSNINTSILDDIFTDASEISESYKPYIAYAVQEGYINGFTNGKFNGKDYLTRAQLCVILNNIFETDVDVYIESNSIMNYTPPAPEPEPEEVKPSYTDEDLEILARIMYCEAGSYWITDEQQMMFGNVVLNRVESPEFPNTVRGVAYQRGQYSPRLFNSYTPDQRTYNNARKLLEGYRCMPPSVVFQANFRQGSGTWKAIQIAHLGTTYFCYSNHMSYYQ